jgi:hypothetical protein
MSRINFVLLAVLFCIGCYSSNGQAARSPFSAFGYGDYFGDALVNNQGMGGTGVGNPQIWFFNNQNPALAINNRFSVFQAGIIAESKRIYSDTIRGESRNGNLNYLLLGFPAWRNKIKGTVNWAMGIGLMPYSNVNYDYQYKDIVGGTEVIYYDRATGGFNQFYWSNGFRINNNLSVGLKTAVLFSSIISDYSNAINDPNQPVPFIPNIHELQRVNGFRYTPGVAYKIDSIRNKYTLNFGATWELKSRLTSETDQLLEKRDQAGNILFSDTLAFGEKGVAEFPDRISAGLSLGRIDKWMIAADFTYTSFGASTASLGSDRVPVKNGYRFAVGGELTPDIRSLGSYLKRITYRAGFSSENGSYLVNGNAVKDFGINFGFSFPVNRISSLDVAFRTGKRGSEKLNGIEENYFKIYFGVTFNDQWFIKRRFD